MACATRREFRVVVEDVLVVTAYRACGGWVVFGGEMVEGTPGGAAKREGGGGETKEGSGKWGKHRVEGDGKEKRRELNNRAGGLVRA